MRLHNGAARDRTLSIEDGLPQIAALAPGASAAECEQAAGAYWDRTRRLDNRLSRRVARAAFDVLARDAGLTSSVREDGAWVSRPPAPGVEAARARLNPPPTASRPGVSHTAENDPAPF